jgi:hypothetical protein
VLVTASVCRGSDVPSCACLASAASNKWKLSEFVEDLSLCSQRNSSVRCSVVSLTDYGSKASGRAGVVASRTVIIISA